MWCDIKNDIDIDLLKQYVVISVMLVVKQNGGY